MFQRELMFLVLCWATVGPGSTLTPPLAVKNAAVEAAIQEVERSKNIEVVFASEFGSRVVGTAREDSDTDLRVLYTSSSPKEKGFQQVFDTVDVTGIKLTRAMELAKDSNTVIFEAFTSPRIHRTIDVLSDPRRFVRSYSVPKSRLHFDTPRLNFVVRIVSVVRSTFDHSCRDKKNLEIFWIF